MCPMKCKTHEIDPRITFESAVACFGTQAALARVLGLERATVCDWKDCEYIPSLHAFRLVALRPEVFGTNHEVSAN